MEWNQFILRVRQQLETANFSGDFPKEHPLTRAIALGLRPLFAESFGVSDEQDLHYHVVYRDGDEDEDRKAWTLIQKVKWVNVLGMDFVPDVLVIRGRLRTATDDPISVLPIEVKLAKQRAFSAEFARAVGQCLVYSVRYQPSILFVGVQPGVIYGTRGLRNVTAANETVEDRKFRERLEQHGIALIFRDVGAPTDGTRSTTPV